MDDNYYIFLHIRISGVYIVGDLFNVGQVVTVTCISDVEVQEMMWLSEETLLETVISQQLLNLMLLVEDRMHNEVYTCRVITIDNTTVEQMITMNVSGK